MGFLLLIRRRSDAANCRFPNIRPIRSNAGKLELCGITNENVTIIATKKMKGQK